MNTAILIGRVSLNTVPKKKYERVSYETTLLAIFAHILALKPLIFYNWFQKNWAKKSGFNETGCGFKKKGEKCYEVRSGFKKTVQYEKHPVQMRNKRSNCAFFLDV